MAHAGPESLPLSEEDPSGLAFRWLTTLLHPPASTHRRLPHSLLCVLCALGVFAVLPGLSSMNRTDRLLAIVLELQRAGRRRAEDLAATFETSKRTIYRDMEALSEAGVPVVAVPGQGYALMEGYFLPPLSFRTDEATMLLLGSDVMAQQFDAQYRAAAQSAAAKIEGVLPAHLRDEVRYLQESFRFLAPGDPAEHETLLYLRRAILDRRAVRFRYTARIPSEPEPPAYREIDPYGLIHIAGAWHVSGHDHLRRDLRTFRLDRIEELTLLERIFARPASFMAQLRPPTEGRDVIVRALFDRETVRWVREARSFFTVAEEETPDGLLITLTVRREEDVLQWLLGWGSHVRVLEPESLRARIAVEAAALLEHHRASLSLLT
jgi:predicted DNA-binding transcriptional regulator YafY